MENFLKDGARCRKFRIFVDNPPSWNPSKKFF